MIASSSFAGIAVLVCGAKKNRQGKNLSPQTNTLNCQPHEDTHMESTA